MKNINMSNKFEITNTFINFCYDIQFVLNRNILFLIITTTYLYFVTILYMFN